MMAFCQTPRLNKAQIKKKVVLLLVTMPVVKAAVWVWVDGECSYLEPTAISHLAKDLAALLRPSFFSKHTDSFLYWPDDSPDVHFVLDTLEVDARQVLHEALLHNKPPTSPKRLTNTNPPTTTNLLASTKPPHVLTIAVTPKGVEVRYSFVPVLRL